MTTIANIDINLRARTDQLDAGLARGRSKTKQAVEEISQMGRMGNIVSPVTDIFSNQVRSLPVIGQVADGFTHAARSAGGFSAAGVAAGAAVGVALAGIVAGAMAAAHAVSQITAQMQEIDRMSDRAKSLGMSLSELTTLDLSLGETSGLDAGTIEASLQKLRVTLANAAAGDANARKMFEQLGLDAADLIAAGPLEAMAQLSEAMDGMTDADQLRVAVELFGKSGAMLVNSLREGPEALREMEQFARSVGMALSDAQAEQVGAANDAWARVEMIATGAWRQIAAEASPVLDVIADKVLGIGAGFSYWHVGLPIAVDTYTKLAGLLFDMSELTVNMFRFMYKISTLDFSGAMEVVQAGADFSTGQDWVDEIAASRQAAAEAAKAAEEKRRVTAEQAEAEINAAKEAERIAEENRRAEENLLKERERVAKAEEDARTRRVESIREEIALVTAESAALAGGLEFDARAARELIEAAGQPPEFVAELQRLQNERKQAEAERDARQEAVDIRESVKSPLDRVAPEFQRISSLLERGLLTREEALAASVKLARENMPGAAGAGASTLVQGTAEAYRKTLEMNAQVEHEKAIEQYAEEQLRVQRDMLAQLKNGGAVLRLA